ncbi:MAG TPA: glycosyltransferase 87 family protein [Candidatus Eisenbacteria bacterium]|nr:glycosyltransferase 87 family protein [Candidatus Eisenbacteria bacterium]
MAGRIGWERWVVSGLGAATIAAIVGPVAAREQAWAGGLAVAIALSTTPWAARHLPASLDGAWRRRRVVSILWALSALLAIAQMGRLSAFMADSSRTWGATVPEPLSTNHACLSAYVYAADLSRRGVENLYDARWYPLFDPPGPTCRLVATPVRGLQAWISDPYEYPPPFLLLPRAALALGASFDDIRAWWFVIQALALIAAGLGLALWLGGAAGATIGLLLPAVLASLETMFTLQFGQFHAAALGLALGAMIAFRERRQALGGALLAAAIVVKLSPAILLVLLATRREWRALAWTVLASAVYSLAALVVLGLAPFTAFFGYQIPRLVSGEAFHFTHSGRHEVFLVSRNFSVAGLGAKLALLGAPPTAIAAVAILPALFTIALGALAIAVARGARSRVEEVLVWLGLLDLAALRSPVAPSAYVLAPVLWLLVLLATKARGRRTAIAALATAWVIVVGPPPLPDRVDLLVSIASQTFVVALCFVTVWAARRTSLAPFAACAETAAAPPVSSPARPEPGS